MEDIEHGRRARRLRRFAVACFALLCVVAFDVKAQDPPSDVRHVRDPVLTHLA